MSLIHDALQKGDSLRWMLPAVPFDNRASRSGDTGKAVRSDRFFLGSTAGLILLLGISWIFFGWQHWHHVRPHDSSPKTKAVSTLPSRLPARTPVLTKPVSIGSDKYVLSGVIDGNEELAVINDQVVAVGDRVGTALVKEIQGRRVILESRGREVYLSLT